MRRSCFLLLPVLLTGCLQTSLNAPKWRYNVKCGGECLELKSKKSLDQTAFLKKVQEHLDADRHASAEDLIVRRLDLGIECLRRRDPQKPPTGAERALARVIDARLGHAATDGWSVHVQGAGQGMSRAEAILTHADDLRQTEQWKSLRDFLGANQTALTGYPEHAVRAGLALAEAQRRTGEPQLACETWQQTVSLAARLFPRWSSPDLWEQIAAQRPVPTPWPQDVAASLLRQLPEPLPETVKAAAFAPEALVWHMVGAGRLDQGDAAAALAAFNRGASHGQFPDWDDFLALHQAKALAAMQQTPAATSLLTTLVARSRWRLPALALLGAAKFQEGQTQLALTFLREAVEPAPADFLWRADAEANLGLAYLTMGERDKGLKSLHDAQDRFQAALDRHGLVQCLQNEAQYHEHCGDTDATHRTRRRLQECEAMRNNSNSTTPRFLHI